MKGGNLAVLALIALILTTPAFAQNDQLREYFPEVEPLDWTDYNVHDPGQTIDLMPDDFIDTEYFYDFSGNGVVSNDIGKFSAGDYVMESLQDVDPRELSAAQTLSRARSFEAYADEDTEFIPGFSDEVLNVELVDLQGNREEFGVTVKEGQKDPISFQDSHYDDADANVYALSTAVNDILNSDDKMETYRQAKKNDQIRIEGNGFMNKMKYGMADVFMKFTGFVFNLFVKKTTVITTTTYYLDEAGNVVDKEVTVEEEVETYSETVDTRRGSVEREQLVTVEDCEDAKKKWEELQADWRQKDCREEKKRLDKATEALNDAKMKLDSAKLSHKAAVEEMETARQEYVNFFKNHLFHNNVEYEPTEGYNSWGVPGTDFTIYFNDDGSALLDYINEFEDEFGKLQRAFYDARNKVREMEKKIEEAQAAHEAAQKEYDAAKKAYEDCLEEKSALKQKVTEFEAEWKDCVSTLKEQEEVKNGLAPAALEEIKRAGTAISGIPDAADGKSDCPEADRLRRDATSAASDARFSRQSAENRYNDAQKSFMEGDLEGAKQHLEGAQRAAEQAQEEARKARDLRNQANAAQARCDRDAAEEARKKAAEEAREEREQERQREQEEREAEELEKVGREVSEDAAEYHDEPQEVSADHLKVGLYTQLSSDVSRECLDTCEKKLLKLGKTAAGQVFVDMTWKLGIGVAKAPIDAISPESLVGKVAQKVTSHLLGAAGADSLGAYAAEAVASEVGGVMFPKLLGDEYLGGKANKLTVNLGKKGIKELLEEEGVQTTVLKYDNGKIWDPCEGWIHCKGQVTMFYNPHTRYVVAIIKGDCCPGALMVKYKVNEYGQAEGQVTKRYFR